MKDSLKQVMNWAINESTTSYQGSRNKKKKKQHFLNLFDHKSQNTVRESIFSSLNIPSYFSFKLEQNTGINKNFLSWIIKQN